MTGTTIERSSLSVAITKLRALALAKDEGTPLGSEDYVLKLLAVSRTTLKQAARSLEREGLVKVKRGVGGGYYSARPNEDTLKSIVSAYLDTINVAFDDVISVTTILWLEVVRRASGERSHELTEALSRIVEQLENLKADASFGEADAIEQDSRRVIFALIDCRYIELIMRINQAFGSRSVAPHTIQDANTFHYEFVAGWRKAKMLEIQAILDGDGPLAEVAARNCRALWNRRVQG